MRIVSRDRVTAMTGIDLRIVDVFLCIDLVF